MKWPSQPRWHLRAFNHVITIRTSKFFFCFCLEINIFNMETCQLWPGPEWLFSYIWPPAGAPIVMNGETDWQPGRPACTSQQIHWRCNTWLSKKVKTLLENLATSQMDFFFLFLNAKYYWAVWVQKLNKKCKCCLLFARQLVQTSYTTHLYQNKDGKEHGELQHLVIGPYSADNNSKQNTDSFTGSNKSK